MTARPAPTQHAGQPLPGPLRYHLVRLVLKFLAGSYVRIRVDGADRLPDSAYIICFNHPSWLDPVIFAAAWPDRRHQLFIFGPREADMSVGWRNKLITWTRRGVAVKPHAADVLDTTRRATAVLRGGGLIAIAGEGHLSRRASELMPLETGLAHFARLAGVPIVPVAVIGTRWVHLGSTVRLRIGRPMRPAERLSGRAGARELTERVQVELASLLDGVREPEPPGRFGRRLSEAFNDWGWLEDETKRHQQVEDDR